MTREEAVERLKQFALSDTFNPAAVADAVEREGLVMWDTGVKDGVEMACAVIELVAADQGPQHLHALHSASEAIRAAHRQLIAMATEDDRRFGG